MTAPEQTPDPSDPSDLGGKDDDQKPGKTDPPQEGGNVEELPAWAREALSKANREAASYRSKVRDLEPLAQKAKEIEDAQKTEAQKAAERLAVAERTASDAGLSALRLEVAIDKGLTKVQAKRLIGSTKEELEADADELVASFGGVKPPATRKPAERLRGGSEPDAEPEDDPDKVAAQVLSRRA